PVGVADSRHVVGQRIEPDPRALNVSVTRGYRERNGPLQVGARDGDVFQSTVNQREEFVASGLRLYELRIVSQQVPEELFVARQAEEPVALFGPLKFASGVQNTVSVFDFVLAFEQLTPYTIPAFVGALVKVIRAALEHMPHECLHSFAMRGVRGANELVVRYAQLRPRGGEPCREIVNELLRSDTMLAGGLRNLLSVFVHSHAEVNVIPGMAVVACDCICATLLAGVPEVRIAVGVINCGRDEGGLHPCTGRWCCPCCRAWSRQVPSRRKPSRCWNHVRGSGARPCGHDDGACVSLRSRRWNLPALLALPHLPPEGRQPLCWAANPSRQALLALRWPRLQP